MRIYKNLNSKYDPCHIFILINHRKTLIFKLMTKKKDKPKAKMGRPSLFDDPVRQWSIAQALYKDAKKTDVEVAEILQVNERTITNWKNKYPDFFLSLTDWKLDADKNVEQSLYKRATGFNRSVERATKEGVVQCYEEVPPDPTSMIFWLKNRQPKVWRDKAELEHSGNLEISVSVEEKYAEDKS